MADSAKSAARFCCQVELDFNNSAIRGAIALKMDTNKYIRDFKIFYGFVIFQLRTLPLNS